jgi:UDP-N-acetylmuramoyl-tripeptide--D-alanyl-D-alanine ligase
MKFRVDEVVGATRGRLAAGRREASAGAVSTDSRALAAGQTFLAIRGERFDGHDFLEGAVARGAACLVVDREDKVPAAASARGTAVVVVKDTLTALADLGRAARGRLTCPVIAVTGSCGKTTVKEMVGQILMRRLRGRTPPASFNNQIGVPLTLLAAEEDDQFVLCEFGTNAPGEIAHHASVARPTIGIVTVVGKVHVEGLGSIEGVAREKAALVEALGPEGVAILNADDPRVAGMAGRCRGRVVAVGLHAKADLQAADVVQTERAISFTVGEGGMPTPPLRGHALGQGDIMPSQRRAGHATREDRGSAEGPGTPVGFEVPVLGEHHVLLALAAAAAAREVGVPLEESAAALRKFQPPPARLHVEHRGGVTVVDDAFNANPLSMRAALAQLGLWPERRKVFFAGDMRELGADSPAEHEALGRAIAEAGVSRLICVGPESRVTAAAARAAGMREENVSTVEDAAAAAAMAPSVVRDGDVVLVKGSHAIHMERVVEALLANAKCGMRNAK